MFWLPQLRSFAYPVVATRKVQRCDLSLPALSISGPDGGGRKDHLKDRSAGAKPSLTQFVSTAQVSQQFGNSLQH